MRREDGLPPDLMRYVLPPPPPRMSHETGILGKISDAVSLYFEEKSMAKTAAIARHNLEVVTCFVEARQKIRMSDIDYYKAQAELDEMKLRNQELYFQIEGLKVKNRLMEREGSDE